MLKNSQKVYALNQHKFKLSRIKAISDENSAQEPYQKISFLVKPLPTSIFIVSMLTILFTGSAIIIWMHNILYAEFDKPQITSKPVTKEPVSLSLNLSSPEPNKLVFDEDLLLAGNTTANSYLMLSNNQEIQTIQVNTDGSFSKLLKLEPGLNLITLASFDKQGNTKLESRTVYYSTEKI